MTSQDGNRITQGNVCFLYMLTASYDPLGAVFVYETKRLDLPRTAAPSERFRWFVWAPQRWSEPRALTFASRVEDLRTFVCGLEVCVSQACPWIRLVAQHGGDPLHQVTARHVAPVRALLLARRHVSHSLFLRSRAPAMPRFAVFTLPQWPVRAASLTDVAVASEWEHVGDCSSEAADANPALVALRDADTGATAIIATQGASLVRLYVPDRHGIVDNVVLGFDEPQAYVDPPSGDARVGCTVGRVAGRITGATFPLPDAQGTRVTLTPNCGGTHQLHGGPHASGMSTASWRLTACASPCATTHASVTLTHESPAGHHGFPGRLRVQATYRLGWNATANGVQLSLRYTACTPDHQVVTPVNLTNHSYFNLDHDAWYGTDPTAEPSAQATTAAMLQHALRVEASRWVPTDANLLPLGTVAKVAPGIDYRGTPVPLHTRLQPPHTGLDHFFVADGALPVETRDTDAGDNGVSEDVRLVAELVHAASGRCLRVHSTAPGVQVYSGQGLPSVTGSGGVPYAAMAGLALETQGYPDAPNHGATFAPLWVTSKHAFTRITHYCFVQS